MALGFVIFCPRSEAPRCRFTVTPLFTIPEQNPSLTDVTHPDDADPLLLRVLRDGVGLRGHGPRDQPPPERRRRWQQPPEENHPQFVPLSQPNSLPATGEVSCLFHDCLTPDILTGFGFECIQLFAPIFVRNMIN